MVNTMQPQQQQQVYLMIDFLTIFKIYNHLCTFMSISLGTHKDSIIIIIFFFVCKNSYIITNVAGIAGKKNVYELVIKNTD